MTFVEQSNSPHRESSCCFVRWDGLNVCWDQKLHTASKSFWGWWLRLFSSTQKERFLLSSKGQNWVLIPPHAKRRWKTEILRPLPLNSAFACSVAWLLEQIKPTSSQSSLELDLPHWYTNKPVVNKTVHNVCESFYSKQHIIWSIFKSMYKLHKDVTFLVF